MSKSVFSESNFQQELRERYARSGVPIEALHAEMREIMAYFGHEAGIDLRDLSQEVVDLYSYHLFNAACAEADARGIHPGTLMDHIDDVMNAAARRTVDQLFVSKGKAS